MLGIKTLRRPTIEMFWVIEYNNGMVLSQFDPFTGKENPFLHVDHKNVIRLWWMPVTPKIAQQFPGTRVNPILIRQVGRVNVETKGSKGFVTRRCGIEITMGRALTMAERIKRGPSKRVICYIVGIEGGPRREIYPDGHIVDIEWPTQGATQDALHHG